MKTRIELVTPKLAEKLLSKNCINRPVKKLTVDFYAESTYLDMVDVSPYLEPPATHGERALDPPFLDGDLFDLLRMPLCEGIDGKERAPMRGPR